MNRPTSLCLAVETLAGSRIHDAAEDLCALANRLGIMCQTEFSKVAVFVMPGDSPLGVIERWERDTERARVRGK